MPADPETGDAAAELAAYKRLTARERAARREAEDLLERKSRELYDLNQSLEQRVVERTRELDRSNYQLRREASRREATQRRLEENEERFRSVVNSMLDGMITVDEQGLIDFANPAAYRLFGYAQGELKGRHVITLLPEDGPFDESAVAGYLTPGGSDLIGVGRELVGRRKDGTTFVMELSASEYHQGDRRMFVGSVRDMTDRKQIEADLRDAKETAEQANAAKSDFLAKMSHELRTPMSAVLGYADILQEPGLGEEERAGYVERIRLNAIHLLALINDLLDLTRIEAGAVTVRQEHASIRELVAEVAELMGVKAQQKDLAFTVEFLTRLPVRVTTDPLRFRQIVINLIGNAIKFTDSGSITVRVSAESVSDGKVRIMVDVTDTGPGIPLDELEAVFDPFKQIRTGRTSTEGTGLGLGISRQIARLLGGDITVETSPGEGSTFRLSIETDFVKGAGQETDPEGNGGEQQTRTIPSSYLSGLRVLLVEDAPDNRLILSRFLERAGMNVTQAENGALGVEQALAAHADGEPFDVILMDMMMPVLDGYGATRTLRESGMVTPIIALTAQAMPEDRARTLEAGCDEYLSKPVKPAVLYETISQALNPE